MAGAGGAGGGNGLDAAGSHADAPAAADVDAADVAAADMSPDLATPVKLPPAVGAGSHLVNPPPPGGLSALGRDLVANTCAVSGEDIVC